MRNLYLITCELHEIWVGEIKGIFSQVRCVYTLGQDGGEWNGISCAKTATSFPRRAPEAHNRSQRVPQKRTTCGHCLWNHPSVHGATKTKSVHVILRSSEFERPRFTPAFAIEGYCEIRAHKHCIHTHTHTHTQDLCPLHPDTGQTLPQLHNTD